MGDVGNPAAYLFRVRQSAVRRFGSRPVPVNLLRASESRMPDLSPELLPALARLSGQQRTIVLLVHACGWSQADVALLEINPATVHEHLGRAIPLGSERTWRFAMPADLLDQRGVLGRVLDDLAAPVTIEDLTLSDVQT